MNIIYKYLFPIPKFDWKINKYEKELIYIPVYEDNFFYDIYNKEYIIENFKINSSYSFKKKEILNNSNNSLLNNTKNDIDSKQNNNNEKYNFNPRIKLCDINNLPKNNSSYDINDISHLSIFSPKKTVTKVDIEKKINLKYNLNKQILKKQIKRNIPCLYLKSTKKTKNILIYFHANSEDIGSAYYLLNLLRVNLEINVVGVEYPHYSIYKTNYNLNEELINEDSIKVVEFFNYIYNINYNDMIIVGRSIGTGPVSYISTKYKFGFCCLISPFKSIYDIVSDFGLLGTIGKLFVNKEIFNNEKKLKLSKNNFIIVHGKKDNIISYTHSEELTTIIEKNFCQLYLFNNIDHNQFDPYYFIIKPIKDFMKTLKYNIIYDNYEIEIKKGINLFN